MSCNCDRLFGTTECFLLLPTKEYCSNIEYKATCVAKKSYLGQHICNSCDSWMVWDRMSTKNSDTSCVTSDENQTSLRFGAGIGIHLGSCNALWRKLLRNLELRIWPKLWPWLPFSQARIISDENIWMFSPLQFHFQFIYGYELKKVFCSSRNCQRISCNSPRLRKGYELNWEDQLNIAFKNWIWIFFSDPG